MPKALDILNADRQAALAYVQKTAPGGASAALRVLLRKAQGDLNARIKQATELKGLGEDSFTLAQSRAALSQINAVVEQLKGGLLSAVLDTSKPIAAHSINGTISYLEASESQFAGVARPTLGLNTALVFERAYSKTESSILHRLISDPTMPQQQGILDRYGAEVIAKFEQSMQVAMVTGKPWGEVRKELVDASPFLKQSPAYWAERILRTETMHAHNRAGFDAMSEINEATGGQMIRILSATVDHRTGSDSLAVHGQIRRMDEPFDHWRGRFMYPPNRPNDREIVVPHHTLWPIPPELRPIGDAEIMARWQAEGRKGSPPPRPKLSTIPLDQIGVETAPTVPDEPAPDATLEGDQPSTLQPQEEPPPVEPEIEEIAASAQEKTPIPKSKADAIAQVEMSEQWGQFPLAQFGLKGIGVGSGYLSFGELQALREATWGALKKGAAKTPIEASKSTKFFAQSKIKASGIELMNTAATAKEVIAELKTPSKKPIVAIRKGDQTIIVDGEAKFAAKALLNQGVTLTIFDFNDPKSKAARAPTAAPVEPEPAKIPPRESRPVIDEDVVLGRKIAGPGGSNDGGIYEGTDGKRRYVKFYDDYSQASGEHLANQIYSDLGVGALDSSVFRMRDGRIAYASRMLDDAKQVGHDGINEDTARRVARGFVGDVLVGNWDAVGLAFDNIVRLPDGNVVRIDNGGSFLMRAKAGRKPLGILQEITEFDGFFNPSINPQYSKLMSKAGYSSALDFADSVDAQLKTLLRVRDQAGGWSAYVLRHSPMLSRNDRYDVEDMLDKRTELLQARVAKLRKEAEAAKLAAARVKETWIKADDFQSLPGEPLPLDASRAHPIGMTGGELDTEYLPNARLKLQTVTPDSVSAIKYFTGTGYEAIRKASRMTRDEWIAARVGSESDYDSARKSADRIQDGFAATKGSAFRPEDSIRTMYRGLSDLDRATFEKLINSKITTFDGPTSVSWKAVRAQGFYSESFGTHGLFYVITPRARKGKAGGTRALPVETISYHNGERELLFPTGSRFRIDRVVRDSQSQRSAIVYITEID